MKKVIFTIHNGEDCTVDLKTVGDITANDMVSVLDASFKSIADASGESVLELAKRVVNLYQTAEGQRDGCRY